MSGACANIYRQQSAGTGRPVSSVISLPGVLNLSLLNMANRQYCFSNNSEARGPCLVFLWQQGDLSFVLMMPSRVYSFIVSRFIKNRLSFLLKRTKKRSIFLTSFEHVHVFNFF